MMLGGTPLMPCASFASSFPHPRDLYIQQLWIVDSAGYFISAVEDSTGALVSFDECELVEFFQTQPMRKDSVEVPSNKHD